MDPVKIGIIASTLATLVVIIAWGVKSVATANTRRLPGIDRLLHH